MRNMFVEGDVITVRYRWSITMLFLMIQAASRTLLLGEDQLCFALCLTLSFPLHRSRWLVKYRNQPDTVDTPYPWMLVSDDKRKTMHYGVEAYLDSWTVFGAVFWMRMCTCWRVMFLGSGSAHLCTMILPGGSSVHLSRRITFASYAKSQIRKADGGQFHRGYPGVGQAMQKPFSRVAVWSCRCARYVMDTDQSQLCMYIFCAFLVWFYSCTLLSITCGRCWLEFGLNWIRFKTTP